MLDHLPHWTAALFLLYAAGCLFVAVRASHIRTVAARMKPSPRQRLLARPAYVLFVRVVAIFGAVASCMLAWMVLHS
ncbi:MAG: hypothetical protein ABI383_02445 [Acidobacteriaceae bacterium]